VHCPQEPRLLRVITQRRPDLGREVVQIRVDDVRARPQPVPQRLFGDDLRPAGDEDRKQIEGLGRKMDFRGAPQELPRRRIQAEFAEGQRPAGSEDPASIRESIGFS
jgi:hypothetical protein